MDSQSRTVGDIWRLALPPGTTLVGGAGGLGRQVEWVASLRAAFPLLGTLEKGYLVLARLSLARQLDGQLTPAYILRELHRAEAAGLVVDEALSAQDVALANELQLPVFVLPPGPRATSPAGDWHHLERQVLRALIDREAQLACREADARAHMQAVFARDGLASVAEELGRLIAGEVRLEEQGGHVVAQSSAALPLGPTSETSLPIKVAGRALGRMVVRTSTVPGTRSLDEMYIRQAAEVCGVELLQRMARRETEERLGQELVEQILDPEQKPEVIWARLERLGYRLDAGARQVVFAVGAPPGVIGNGPAQACARLARDLQLHALRDNASVLGLDYRQNVLVLCSLAPTLADQAARHWATRAVAEASYLPANLHTGQSADTPHARCTVGVSRVLGGSAPSAVLPGAGRTAGPVIRAEPSLARHLDDSIADLRAAISQALGACALGQKVRGLSSPYHYDDLGLYRLLAGLRTRDELARFYEETLGPLVRYDTAHGTELVHTLEVFYQENANASQSARTLHVHRNTLSYRLQRIVEITGLDLDQPEARLALQMACKYRRLL